MQGTHRAGGDVYRTLLQLNQFILTQLENLDATDLYSDRQRKVELDIRDMSRLELIGYIKGLRISDLLGAAPTLSNEKLREAIIAACEKQPESQTHYSEYRAQNVSKSSLYPVLSMEQRSLHPNYRKAIEQSLLTKQERSLSSTLAEYEENLAKLHNTELRSNDAQDIREDAEQALLQQDTAALAARTLMDKQDDVVSDSPVESSVATIQDNARSDQETVCKVEVLHDKICRNEHHAATTNSQHHADSIDTLLLSDKPTNHFLSMIPYYYPATNTWNMFSEVRVTPVRDFAGRRPPKEPGKAIKLFNLEMKNDLDAAVFFNTACSSSFKIDMRQIFNTLLPSFLPERKREQ